MTRLNHLLVRLSILLFLSILACILTGITSMKSYINAHPISPPSKISQKEITETLSEKEQKYIYYYATDRSGNKYDLSINEEIFKQIVYKEIYRHLYKNNDYYTPTLFPYICNEEIFRKWYDAYYKVFSR